MNWLERARREIQTNLRHPTVITAERTPMAVTSVLDPALRENSRASFGSNGSTSAPHISVLEFIREEFEERAAIMEFDGDLSRDDAELNVWTMVTKRERVY